MKDNYLRCPSCAVNIVGEFLPDGWIKLRYAKREYEVPYARRIKCDRCNHEWEQRGGPIEAPMTVRPVPALRTVAGGRGEGRAIEIEAGRRVALGRAA